MAINVSVIIVNYNTEKLVLQCIHSLYKFSKNFSFEIIVVDNASTDESVKSIRLTFPDVKLIASVSNLGFARANNLGVEQANGNFFFFLNPDTELIENSIYVLLNYMQFNTDKKIGVLGCRMIDKARVAHVSYGNFPSLWQEIFQYGAHKVFSKYYSNKLSSAVADSSNDIKKVDYIIGANLFIAKDVFLSCGKFDNDFFLYYEETELCFRLRKLGFLILFLPHTQIIHHYGAASKKKIELNFWLFEQTTKSKFLYYRKCYGLFSGILLYLILIPKVLYTSLQYKNNKVFAVFTRSAKSVFK